MNIFVLSENPTECAKFHCDKHVVKMILESAQLLCTCHWLEGGKAPYKATHKNHPCSIWVRESLDNYLFLCKLGMALCLEYTKRYGKIHKTQAVIEWAMKNLPKIPRKGLTPFAQAMPDEYKSNDAVEAYRKYYVGAKKDLLKYTGREMPSWISNS